MYSALKLGGAFIGLMAGIGFASGQEILQFFASYGWYGIAGAFVASIVMIFFVMNLYSIGSQLQTLSHEEAINFICGNKIGKAIDIMLTFFLFSVIVVMLAGAGSSLHQQLGMPQYLGSLFAGIISIFLVFLGLKKVISILSFITPILALMIIIIAIYSLTHISLPFYQLAEIIQKQPKATGSWFLSALLYVSYNIAGLTAMLVVIGGNIKDLNNAKLGGLFGGIGIGILISLMILVLISSSNLIKNVEIPTLFLGNKIAVWFGNLVLIFLQAKLIITCMGLTYALAARCKAYGVNFKLATILSVSIAYLGSLLGFVNLVSLIYPAMGYLGFILMFFITLKWFQLYKNKFYRVSKNNPNNIK
ncbi:hypothetical protein [Acinetobacter lactucae]|uniref:YkvI family membrane protein n=1 Tax=Acinetobacter lactucae TaxID=1785128 RepID=UPI00077E25DF|nr:hypothetical protein [Acinetobacter lactucae]